MALTIRQALDAALAEHNQTGVYLRQIKRFVEAPKPGAYEDNCIKVYGDKLIPPSKRMVKSVFQLSKLITKLPTMQVKKKGK